MNYCKVCLSPESSAQSFVNGTCVDCLRKGYQPPQRPAQAPSTAAIPDPPPAGKAEQLDEGKYSSPVELITGGVIAQVIGAIAATACAQGLTTGQPADRTGYYLVMFLGVVAVAAGTVATAIGVIRWGVQPLID